MKEILAYELALFLKATKVVSFVSEVRDAYIYIKLYLLGHNYWQEHKTHFFLVSVLWSMLLDYLLISVEKERPVAIIFQLKILVWLDLNIDEVFGDWESKWKRTKFLTKQRVLIVEGWMAEDLQ